MKALYLFLAVVLILRLVSPPASRARRITPRETLRRLRTDWTVLIAVPYAFATAAPIVEYFQLHRSPSVLHSAMGIVLLFVAAAVGNLANREITRNWSPSIRADDHQALVTSGIYCYVRHPLYLAAIIWLAAVCTYFAAVYSWLALVLALGAILVRIPLEEKQLAKRFPEYGEYRRGTKMLIPWLL